MDNGNDDGRDTFQSLQRSTLPPINLMQQPQVAKVAAGVSAAAKLAAAQKDKYAQDFSQAVAVLMRDPSYKNLRLADLEWLVVPPLLAGQARVAVSRMRKDGPLLPVAVALWARVSAAVDKRLSEELEKPPLLTAREWTCGDVHWLITLAGDQQAMSNFLPQLRASVFKDRAVKVRVQDKDGRMVVQTLAPRAAAR